MLAISIIFAVAVVLIGLLFRFVLKPAIGWVVRRQMEKEFYAELSNRVRASILLEPLSPEAMKAMVEGASAPKPNAFTRRYDELWELERSKLLSERSSGAWK